MKPCKYLAKQGKGEKWGGVKTEGKSQSPQGSETFNLKIFKFSLLLKPKLQKLLFSIIKKGPKASVVLDVQAIIWDENSATTL